MTNECIHCKKVFSTKSNLNAHIKTCKVLNKNVLCDEKKYMIEEIEILKEQNKKLKEENSDFKLKLLTIKLETENEIYKKYAQTVTDIAKQPKNSNINNFKNNIISFDLRDEENIKNIQTKMNSTFEEKHFMEGQKGVAIALVNGVLKTGEGINNKYLISDHSRSIFKTKDKYGNIIYDQGASLLTDIVYRGIKDKVGDISRMCMDREKNNLDMLVFISNNVLGITKMREDNSDFRKELLKSG
jgi:hypothetical protein